MSKNKHNQLTGSEIDRSDDRIAITNELFTPLEVCNEMIAQIPELVLKNPNSKFLDNSAGAGNFLLALQTKLQEYHSLQHINDHMLYAVELMEDNHQELCKRLGVSTSHEHFVCKDTIGYDHSFGELMLLESELGKVKEPLHYSPQLNKEASQARLPL